MTTMQAILLGLLQQGDLYGYQLRRGLQQEAFEEWGDVSVGPFYRELDELVRQGMIEPAASSASMERPARTLYRITEEGGAVFTRFLREAWLEEEPSRSPRDVAAFFMDALPKTEGVSILQERLQYLRGESRRVQLAQRERQVDSEMSTEVDMILDHASLRLESEIAWTGQMLARLGGDQPPQPDAETSPRLASQQGGASEAAGAFAFVLHSHLPYCRKAGAWPHGEEWIHEAIIETYIPLLDAFYDLCEEGVAYSLTVSLSPVLLEQLADADIQANFVAYLDRQIEAARNNGLKFRHEGNVSLKGLADHYQELFVHVKEAYRDRFNGDLVGAFRQLQDNGYLEIITSAATHGYLPLLGRDSSIYAQLRVAVETYKRHFRCSPRAIWLPECAYRPAIQDAEGNQRPAIEEFLAPMGFTCFFVETHAIEKSEIATIVAEDVLDGAYGPAQPSGLEARGRALETRGTTFDVYYVAGPDGVLTEPPVAVLGRNGRTSRQVWSAHGGYPGDPDYRDFHKKHHDSGLRYWRVTGPGVDLGDKDIHHLDWAEYKVGEHAHDFIGLVEALARDHQAETGEYGIVSSHYDAELFGHWWFEGVAWLKETLRGLAQSKVIDLTTARAYVAAHQPKQSLILPESSWGAGGGHDTWDQPDTHWMWETVHKAERRMEHLVAMHPEAEGDALLLLNQAARELLLLESSDWPFLVTTGQAKDYGIERFDSHLERFNGLAEMAEREIGPECRERAKELYALDKVFPDIDYRWFRERQGIADAGDEKRGSIS